MLYQLFNWLKQSFDIPGAGLFQFLTFRIAMAIVLSLVIATVYGKRIILFLQKKQIGESVRDLGLAGQEQKKGTPTMGGIIILLSILIPTLLFANLDKVYVRLMVLCTVWLGIIGFLDDLFKIRARKAAQQKGETYKKKDSDGLAGISKIIGQVGLGIIIGTTLYFSNAVTVEREIIGSARKVSMLQEGERFAKDSTVIIREINGLERKFVKVKTPITTIPFVKNHEFNYSKLISWMGEGAEKYTWIVYILIVTLIITAVSNGANLTDGLDGLATGTSAVIGACLGIFAYASGNLRFAEYLNIMYIPNLGELSVFIGALIGACVGFLWYNAYPAQVFMGDTGSLTLGGIIAALAIIVRKELLIPVLCGIFLIENLSVMLQVAVFKYRKKKYGLEYAQNNRLFKMSPLHHHYQKSGFHESKIVNRMVIIGVMLAIVCLITLKIR